MNLLSMLKKGAFRQSSHPTVAAVATVTVIGPRGLESALDASAVYHTSPVELDRHIELTVATVSNVAKVKNPSIKLFETYFSPVNSTSFTRGECAPQALATVTVATIATVDSVPPKFEMTDEELHTFTARVARITDRGSTREESEVWAEKLLQRDREQDDRTVCLECNRLGGTGPSSWRCGNWRRAGIALRARDAELPKDLVQLLQRCPGFNVTHLRNPK
jgi:hypothetical protein